VGIFGNEMYEPTMQTVNPKNPSSLHTSHKRTRDQVDSDSDSENEIDFWPRFLIMESTDSSRPLSKLSPFALQKGIQGLAGVAKNITRLRSGQILIEVDKKSHANNLLQSTMIVDVPIRISSH
jgi:hypothetical protein